MSAMYSMVFTSLMVVLTSALGDTCPYKTCNCYGDTIDCSHLGLTRLPELTPVNTSQQFFLNISNNAITSIDNRALPSDLYGIDLQGNPIRNIDQEAFVGSADTLATLQFSKVHLEYSPFAFLYLGNLQHLSIKDSYFQEWDIDIWYSLGNCVEDLTLVNIGVTSWPPWVQTQPLLYRLEFSSAVVSIPDNAFESQVKTLTSLTLKNVTMTSTGRMFSKLTVLTELILDNNRISHVTGLPHFGKLTSLSLNNNDISNTTMLIHALHNVNDSLQSLQVDGNKLTVFPDLSFMTRLQRVHLSHNLIYNVNEGFLPAALILLVLEDNRLTTLGSFLQSGSNIKTLSLRSNLLTDIKGTDFSASVADMDVSENQLSVISESYFPSDSNITTLRFDFNPISTVSVAAFDNLAHLSYLSLISTKITRLPVSIMSLRTLTTLDFSDNSQLICTCRDSMFRPWYTSQKANINGKCGLTSIDFFLRSLSIDCPSKFDV